MTDDRADWTHPEQPGSEQPVGRDRLCTFPEPETEKQRKILAEDTKARYAGIVCERLYQRNISQFRIERNIFHCGRE